MTTTGAAPHVVIVWKPEGVGFSEIVGPFANLNDALIRRDRYPVATVFPLTDPEAER
jgi:hypothetical protein